MILYALLVWQAQSAVKTDDLLSEADRGAIVTSAQRFLQAEKKVCDVGTDVLECLNFFLLDKEASSKILHWDFVSQNRPAVRDCINKYHEWTTSRAEAIAFFSTLDSLSLHSEDTPESGGGPEKVAKSHNSHANGNDVRDPWQDLEQCSTKYFESQLGMRRCLSTLTNVMVLQYSGVVVDQVSPDLHHNLTLGIAAYDALARNGKDWVEKLATLRQSLKNEKNAPENKRARRAFLLKKESA